MLLLQLFAIDRTAPSKSKIHVHKISSNIVTDTEERQFTKILSRTELKRLRWQKIGGPGVSTTFTNDYNNESSKTDKNQHRSFFSLLFCCFYDTVDLRDSGHGDVKNIEKDDKATELIKTEVEIEEAKAKRFVSQSRLMRGKQEEKDSFDADFDCNSSLSSFPEFDLSQQRLIQNIINERKMKRAAHKELQQSQGVVDVVVINSGPPKDLIPPGYVLSSEPPEMTPQSLIYKNVMYLWEDVHPRAVGWFFGMINGVSKVSGCNYNIKYDRADTKNVYVDGVKNVNLTLFGDNAYGKRWVIVVKTSKAIT
eukprot:gene22688-30971_t